jgi:hypothetical protein
MLSGLWISMWRRFSAAFLSTEGHLGSWGWTSPASLRAGRRSWRRIASIGPACALAADPRLSLRAESGTKPKELQIK